VKDYHKFYLLFVARRSTRSEFQISIDTRNATTAEWAIDIGADIINDVAALEGDGMKELAAIRKETRFIFMHNLGTPPNKKVIVPTDQDVVTVLTKWASEKIDEFAQVGIEKDRLVFDPGIAFGKTAIQSLDLIHRAAEFHGLGVPLCYGHSRKTYIVPQSGLSVPQRDGVTAGFSHYLATQGIQYLRVHDVETNYAAVQGDGDNIFADDWYSEYRHGLVERSRRRLAVATS